MGCPVAERIVDNCLETSRWFESQCRHLEWGQLSVDSGHGRSNELSFKESRAHTLRSAESLHLSQGRSNPAPLCVRSSAVIRVRR